MNAAKVHFNTTDRQKEKWFGYTKVDSHRATFHFKKISE